MNITTYNAAVEQNKNFSRHEEDYVSLSWADLYGADLIDADLYGANLRDADLRGADCENITMNWQSHNLIAERLRQKAQEDPQLILIGVILIGEKQEWCWEELIEKTSDFIAQDWAMKLMQTWIKDGDNAPDILVKWKAAP